MEILAIISKILSGASASLLIFFLTLIFALPLGFPIAFAKLSKCKFLSFAANGIISVLRGTPLMLQLIVWFYGPYYIFGIRLSPSWRIVAIIIGFSINYAAYFAEIYRAGMQCVSKGQYEAALVLGYSERQTFFKIILPQLIRNVLPAITNEVITLIKDTSIAFVVAYPEMFTIAKQVAAAKTTVLPLFIAGGFYYIFNCLVAFVMGKIEKKFSYYSIK